MKTKKGRPRLNDKHKVIRFNFLITEDLVKLLDQAVKKKQRSEPWKGWTKSGLIRELLYKGVSEHINK